MNDNGLTDFIQSFLARDVFCTEDRVARVAKLRSYQLLVEQIGERLSLEEEARGL